MVQTFLKYYLTYRYAVLLMILGSVITTGLEMAFPALVREIMNIAPHGDVIRVITDTAVLAGAYLANFGLQYLLAYNGFVMAARFEKDLRRDLFAHMQVLPIQYFDNHHTGQLLSRLTSDVSEVSELAFRAPQELVVCILTMVGSIVVMLYMNPTLGALVTLMLIAETWHALWLNKKMKTPFYNKRVKMGEMTAVAEEEITGIRVVKSFARESISMKSFMQQADEYVTVSKLAYRVRAFFFSSVGFFTNIINVVVLFVGGILVVNEQMPFSDLVAFFLYIGIFIKPMMRLLGFSEAYQRGMAGFRRFYELMQEPVTIADHPNAIKCKSIRGEIVFHHVSFAYEDNIPVLSHLDLHIAAGETIAFVGSTGAGKTTIANLLLRFYEPQEGSILIDGCPIDQYTQASLREQIGLVQQDVFLFASSIANNIAYGKLDAKQEEIEQAAHLAAADIFIENLPQQYDSVIGERGVKLSGGQKQRLAIARVFLKNPPILVLDEATSALDTKTEQQIQKELERLSEGRTTIIIAHRLSTIRHADHIVVLDNGKIVEEGTHETLLMQKGVYATLYENQNK